MNWQLVERGCVLLVAAQHLIRIENARGLDIAELLYLHLFIVHPTERYIINLRKGCIIIVVVY